MIEWFDDLALGMRFKSGEKLVTRADLIRFASEFRSAALPSRRSGRQADALPTGLRRYCSNLRGPAKTPRFDWAAACSGSPFHCLPRGLYPAVRTANR